MLTKHILDKHAEGLQAVGHNLIINHTHTSPHGLLHQVKDQYDSYHIIRYTGRYDLTRVAYRLV